jgi:hypothetical protein
MAESESKSKEVAIVSESEERMLVAEYAGYAGVPDVHDAEPLRAPILRWQHAGASTATKEGGKFYNSLEGPEVAYEEIPCVILDGKNSRAFYREAYDPKKPKTGADAMPDCKSADGMTGVGDPGGECSACAYSRWGEDGRPPRCSLSYDRLIFDFHTHQPGVISFARTKIKAIQAFQAAIKARNGGLIPAWAYKVVIRSEKREAYWVPRIDIIGLMPKEEALVFQNIKTDTNAAFMRATGETIPAVVSETESEADDAISEAASAY